MTYQANKQLDPSGRPGTVTALHDPLDAGSRAARFGRMLALCTLATVFAVLLLGTSMASAAEVHAFSKSFGAGKLSLGEHSGVAVNRGSGDVYVADSGDGRVAEFGSDGTFVRGFGALTAPTYVAVDNSTGSSAGDVYVADTSDNTVTKFDSAGNLVAGFATGGKLTVSGPSLAGIAVGIAGGLWVYNEGGEMQEYSSSGSRVTGWSSGFGVSAVGIAIDAAENLYVVRGSGAVAKFSSAGALLNEELDPGPTTGLTIDPSNGVSISPAAPRSPAGTPPDRLLKHL